MKRLINLCIFLFMSNLVFSQAWMHYLPSHKAENEITFYDCQEAFQRWCREKNIDSEGFFINDSGNKQKAYGFKQFRRWEIAMEGWYDQMTGEIFRKVPYHEYEQFRKMYLENTESVVGDWVNVAYSQAGTWNNGNGRVNCIALHPDDPDIFWIGTAWGGIWETQDHGATWTPKSDFIGGLGIGAIAVPDDYATSHTIYLGTGDRGYYSDYGVGLLKSTDDGNTWFATGLSYSEPVNTYIGKILIHPDNNNIILAATSEGIYKSVDAGANFSMVWTGRTVDMEFHPTNPDIVYATTRWVRFEENTKILRSVNGGQAWEIIQTVDGCRTELAVSPDEPGWVYAIVGNYQEGLEGVYRSTDSGASFTKVFDGSISGNNILGGDCAGVDIGGQAGYDLAIAADANDAQKVTIGGISIWQSNNGGAAWTPLTRSYHNCGGTSSVVHVDIHYLLYRDDSDTLFATSDGGVYYSVDNGINWINISTGLFINQPYRVSSSAAGYDEILMGQQDNGVVLWDNNTANFVGGGDGTNVIINPLDINNQYFTNNSSAVTCTNDHWATKYYFNTPTDSTVSWFKAMHLIPAHVRHSWPKSKRNG